MDEAEAHRLRRKMVVDQIEARGIHNPAVLAAMRTVPRHLFVPPDLRDKAYRDRPLNIGHDQTISQPYMVAAMTELLKVGAGDRVLEVGTGSGYQAAVLAEVCSQVYSVEVVEALADEARERFATMHYTNIHVKVGDGALGWPEEAPFDGIIVTCAPEQTPSALLDQLAPGRRLVIPLGKAGQVMQLRVWTKSDEGRLAHEDVMRVRFVPLVSESAD